MATHTPNTMLASICSLRLISRPIFKVGSLFPERYSLTREGLIPSSWVRLLCVVPPRRVLHCLCLLEVFLHIGSSGDRAHRRFLWFGNFPHLPLHGFFVKLVQIHHCPSYFYMPYSAKVTTFTEKQKKFPRNKIHTYITESPFPPATLRRGGLINSRL